MERLRVLLVEDSANDAALVVRALRTGDRSIEDERVETAGAMRAALDRGPWDLVVSDWSMPVFDALGALRLLKERESDVPFIVVSGTIEEEAGVEAMRAGANDYVLKSKLERLAPAVEREIREHQNRRARRAAEVARGEAELRFKRLFDSAVTGVMVTDVSGVVLDANDALLEMIGFSHDELRAGAVNGMELTPPEWRDVSLSSQEILLAEGKVRPFEKEYVRKDRTRVPVHVHVVRLDANRFLTIVTDLTERRRTERALALLEEQLRQSQKMDAIGRLAGGIAHDFNNMLSVILSYSELVLADLREGDPMREDIDEIHRAGARAADLTRQLLVFSRQQIVEPRVIDLNSVLANMDRMLRRILGEDVDLASIAGGSIGFVRIDPSSLEQVIMNLVVNARDAMPIGGKLTLETASVELDERYAGTHLAVRPGSYVVLSVTDTGFGMDRATMARIFEPFFTTKQQGRGTGLGLSTVFGIVQQSGGSVWVYSEPGLGTTFKVYLPRVDAAAAPVRSLPSPATLRGSEVILLAEDDDQVRSTVRDILRRHGYVVLEARNAGEALLISERHDGRIDLLLTDVVMPQTSGPELAKRLALSRPQMRVLCMSGYTDDAALRHGVIDGAFAYVQKPITIEALTRKIRAVLDADRPVAAVAGGSS